jgi:hypothetical protein
MWEPVYTINEFGDRPWLGVADVSGVPHIYSSPFNTVKDDFEDFYLVSVIRPGLFELVLEDWDIWMRWSEAFDKREASNETHPALPEDRPRHDELVRLIGTRLKVDSADAKKLNADFRNAHLGWNGMEVRWSDASLAGITEASPTPPDQYEPD